MQLTFRLIIFYRHDNRYWCQPLTFHFFSPTKWASCLIWRFSIGIFVGIFESWSFQYIQCQRNIVLCGFIVFFMIRVNPSSFWQNAIIWSDFSEKRHSLKLHICFFTEYAAIRKKIEKPRYQLNYCVVLRCYGGNKYEEIRGFMLFLHTSYHEIERVIQFAMVLYEIFAPIIICS